MLKRIDSNAIIRIEWETVTISPASGDGYSLEIDRSVIGY